MVTKSLHQARIERFMQGVGQDVPVSPSVPSEEVRVLRAKLILEEALETVRAMGLDPLLTNQHGTADTIYIDDIDFDVSPDNIRIEEVIDGCCDLSVVTIGTLSAFGVPDAIFLEEIDCNNLSKVEGGYRREDGKWMKPDDWQPPSIMNILNHYWPNLFDVKDED